MRDALATEPEPLAELIAFSSDDAIPTQVGQGRKELQDALSGDYAR